METELPANSMVDVIDSIVITRETNTSQIIAEWSKYDGSITTYENLTSASAVKLSINWSDQGGTLNLQQGDYTTFVIPSIFNHDYITTVTDVPLQTLAGEVVATYSITINSNNLKELTITFTDYVETHTHISGDLWLLLFTAKVTTSESKPLEIIVNGNLEATGEITIDPPTTGHRDPEDEKFGLSVVKDIYEGYYIFSWTVRLNMEEDPITGFHKIQDFSFEDIIPEDSPHVFLTEEIRQRLGLLPNQFPLRVGEYLGADSYAPLERYPFFQYQYNSSGSNYWTDYNNYQYLVDGYTTTGIDGGSGLEVTDLVFTEKTFSANLGTLTRPTTLQYCTIATINIAESALGDAEVVKLFTNTFKASYGYETTQSLQIHYFSSGGTAQGIIGDYGFTFIKVNENDTPLPGALFGLYISEDFTVGADRIVYSDTNGIVSFQKLPANTYYVKEISNPSGYILNETIFKVVLTSTGFNIFYGKNYEYNLADQGNKVENQPEGGYEPIRVRLSATKSLVGQTLSDNMFNFLVKNQSGQTVATGSNYATGNIIFTEIEFDLPGTYNFTIEEVRGYFTDITYDTHIYPVVVTIIDAGNKTLDAQVFYPGGEILFNNRYFKEEEENTCHCPNKKTRCRKTIEGRVLWYDNNNEYNKRPTVVEVILYRDEQVYKTAIVNSNSDGTFTFCCIPLNKNTTTKYYYRVDLKDRLVDYTTSVNGYIITNKLNG